MTDTKVDRSKHTAKNRAAGALNGLEESYMRWFAEKAERTDFRELCETMFNERLEPLDADAFALGIFAKDNPDAADRDYVGMAGLIVGAAYCMQAIKAFDDGRVNEAWGFAFDGAGWDGYMSGLLSGGNMPEMGALREFGMTATEAGRKGLDVRHAQNRENKRVTFEWADANCSKYTTLVDMAMAVVADEVTKDAPFSTVRGYLTEWNRTAKRF